MSSFTSDSENHWMTVVMILAIVLAAEVTLRASMPFVSGSLKHIKEIPCAAEKLSKSDGLRILFLGNSMINNGVDVKIIREKLENKSMSIINVVKINPDGTDLWDWYFLYKNYFLIQSNPPDLIVLGFRSDFVDDQRQPNPSRLAANFSGLRDLPELIDFGMTGRSEIAEYLYASSICLYAHREAIRNRLMDWMVPYYRENTSKIGTNAWKAKSEAWGEVQEEHSYRRLESLLRLVRSKCGMVVLVAMPTRNKYALKKEILLTTEKSNAVLMDLRDVRGLSEANFIDAVHLNAAGAEVLSQELGERLTYILFSIGNAPRDNLPAR